MNIGIHTGQNVPREVNFGTLITKDLNLWKEAVMKKYIASNK